MKRLLAGAGALATIAYGNLGFIGNAWAQRAPIPEPIMSAWTGLYAGVNGGSMWGDSSTNVATTLTSLNTAGLSPLGQTYGPTAVSGANGTLTFGNATFIGGGQVGYNYQVLSGWLVGIEADIAGLASSSSGDTNYQLPRGPAAPGDFVSSGIAVTKQLDYFGTLRARFGYLVDPTVYLYGTGGLAFGGARSSTTLTAVEIPNTGSTNVTATGQASKTLAGYAIGVGGEWLLDLGWSVTAEYLYYSLGNLSYANTPFSAVLSGTNTVDFSANSMSKARFSGNIIRLGVNYHF